MTRLVVDLSMTILILWAFAYHITGNTAHEWIGVSFIALCVVHNIINWRWYKNIFKGTYNPVRAITAGINCALALDIAVLAVTGLLLSRSVLSFLDLAGGLELRGLHTAAAYWLLVLASVHIGLYWGKVTGMARKIAGVEKENRARAILLRLLAFAIAGFGAWSFIDRDMFGKLFLGLSFDYWDDTRPAIVYFAMMFSIVGMYTFIVHYGRKLLQFRKKAF